MTTVIKFDEKDGVGVTETPSEVIDALVAVKADRNPPMVQFTTPPNGAPVWVNADKVRMLREL